MIMRMIKVELHKFSKYGLELVCHGIFMFFIVIGVGWIELQVKFLIGVLHIVALV